MTHKTATRPLVLTEKVMVTLSADQRARLEEIAKAEDRSMTSICRRFVEQGISKSRRSAR